MDVITQHYDLLTAIADLADTFLRTHELNVRDKLQVAVQALDRVMAALCTVRHLLDPRNLTAEQLEFIDQRCLVLDAEISART